ncbi:MAG: ABC transporter permease subunit [Kofleriaceae bacterium]
MNWTPLALSLEIATIAMLVSLVLGTALALLLTWKKLPVPDLFHALVQTPLVLPPTVLGFYLLTLLGPHSLIGRAYHAITGNDIVFTFGAAVIAATIGSLPLVIGAVRVGLDAIDPNLTAAARVLGASKWRVLRTITLPLAAPALAAGAMLGFARALGDYGMTQMIASVQFDGIGISKGTPASIYVIQEMVALREESARNMALATTIVGLTLLVIASRLTRRLHARR